MEKRRSFRQKLVTLLVTVKIKACNPFGYKPFCALDWIRTSTPVKELPPQDSVSTNSTTRAAHL